MVAGKRKLLSLGLAAAMVCSLCFGGAGTVFAAEEMPAKTAYSIAWYNETDTTFVLDEPEELAGLAAIVNGEAESKNGTLQDSFQGKTIVLEGDLDLSGIDWEPIGTISFTVSGVDDEVYKITSNHTFEGTFDGKGHVISGLTCEDSFGGSGLFGCSSGVLKDFTLEGTVTGKHVTAGVAAIASGTISGVTNKVSVTAAGNCIGGIVGDAMGDLKLVDCHNQGTISNGHAISDKSTGRVGGIIGRVDVGRKVLIEACSNAGALTGYQYVGGIAGGVFGNATIDSCCNTGNLEGISFGKVYLGGITGKLGDGTIANCYNTGSLTDNHWNDGHIRAVGGIAGSEEGHDVGTAITNCYTTGKITLHTENMTHGRYYIYMTGNISGGNSVSGENEMQYANCFYLENRLDIADPEHPGYKYWSDVYKKNPLAYDTDTITCVSRSQLKGEAVQKQLGGAFFADEAGVNSGYPILYWQAGKEKPDAAYGVTVAAVTGGQAKVAVSATEAKAGQTIMIAVSEVEAGKQVREILVADQSGAKIEVTKTADGGSFVMPARVVTVTVYLEKILAADAAAYPLQLPTDLDATWEVQVVPSAYYDSGAGTMKEGAVTTIRVTKNQKAETTDFTGITVTAGGKTVPVTELERKSVGGASWYGEYSFEMPGEAVQIAVNITYKSLTVTEEQDGQTTKKATFSRAEVLTLGANNRSCYYSGWDTETTGFVSVAERYVTVEQLLQAAGLHFQPGDAVRFTAADGMDQTFTYEELMGESRYYYPNIFREDDTDKVSVPAMLVIQGNKAVSQEELDGLLTDTAYAYKLAFGQSEAEFAAHQKIVDRQIRTICQVTLVKGDAAPTELVNRISGTTRYETSIQIAEELKASLGVDKFDTVILTTGMKFADALSGSSLAAALDAPILMIDKGKAEMVSAYVRDNLKAGGKIYVLGGNAAVPESLLSSFKGYQISRLAGSDRYATNLVVLNELKQCDVSMEQVAICTGMGYADSLSVSAANLPILLVGDTLGEAQRVFLSSVHCETYYLIGGTKAVSVQIENAVKTLGKTERVYGATRLETSVAVAETFYGEVDTVIIAAATDFPDALCGGPLAVKTKSPLLLCAKDQEQCTKSYLSTQKINHAKILGGEKAVSEQSVERLFLTN